MECDFEVGIAKRIGYFSCHGVIISKCDPCSEGGGGSIGLSFVGDVASFYDIRALSFMLVRILLIK